MDESFPFSVCLMGSCFIEVSGRHRSQYLKVARFRLDGKTFDNVKASKATTNCTRAPDRTHEVRILSARGPTVTVYSSPWM